MREAHHDQGSCSRRLRSTRLSTELNVSQSKSHIVNAMTVDVEDYFHVAALAKSIDRSRWDNMEYRVEANTRRLLDLFEQSHIRATFFVLGWVARRSPDLIKEIHRRGHEVASHGMSHKLVFNQTPEEFF